MQFHKQFKAGCDKFHMKGRNLVGGAGVGGRICDGSVRLDGCDPQKQETKRGRRERAADGKWHEPECRRGKDGLCWEAATSLACGVNWVLPGWSMLGMPARVGCILG